MTVGLLAAIAAFFLLSLMLGNTFYGPGDVVRVLLGEDVKGASFAVGELRLPRASMGVLSGFCFGMAGVTFQTMLRNPLASPDIIGVTAGASAAAVVGIAWFSLNDTMVSLLALAGALLTSLLMSLLSINGGFSSSRMILIGIGFAAMLRALVSYVLAGAKAWDLQVAMRWLTGSLNGATWERTAPLFVAVTLFGFALVLGGRQLDVMRLGDETAAALGVKVRSSRTLVILAAVAMLAFATAAAGPVSFVAFMAGPIAARMVGNGASLLIPAGLIGALLVLVADLVGQHALGHRYPVGVITGVLGAPYLVVLLVQSNRSGGSL